MLELLSAKQIKALFNFQLQIQSIWLLFQIQTKGTKNKTNLLFKVVFKYMNNNTKKKKNPMHPATVTESMSKKNFKIITEAKTIRAFCPSTAPA